jgi:hypothetical protein
LEKVDNHIWDIKTDPEKYYQVGNCLCADLLLKISKLFSPPLVHQPVKDRYRPGGWLVEHHYDPKDHNRPGGWFVDKPKILDCGALKSEHRL